MKFLRLLSAACLILASCVLHPAPARAQADPFGGILTNAVNIDTNATLFSAEKFEVRTGVLSQGVTGTEFNSLLAGSYYFHESFGVGAEMINGTMGGSVESTHLTLELRRPLGNFCVAGFMGPGWNFHHGAFEGTAGLRVSYVPAPITTRVFTYAESRLIVDSHSIKAPSNQFAMGVGYSF